MNKKELREASNTNRAYILSLLPFRQANRFLLRRLFAERQIIRSNWNWLSDLEDRAYAISERHATGGYDF